MERRVVLQRGVKVMGDVDGMGRTSLLGGGLGILLLVGFRHRRSRIKSKRT